MTIQTQFWNWQNAPMQPDPRRCAPIGQSWMAYLLDIWGGQNLGCYAARPVVGGSSMSSHASGAAIDWRYESPGIGRQRMLDEVMPFLINNSMELGIQAIHDYVGCTIWRPPATSGRPAQQSPECGWRNQTPGSQMGQSWALWLHIECLNTRWSDTRSVNDMLPTPTPVPPIPEEDEMLFDGFWQRDNHTAVYAIWKNGTKQWMTDPGYLDAMTALQRINGADDVMCSIRVQSDPSMFAAFGLVVGPLPDGCDQWGNPV